MNFELTAFMMRKPLDVHLMIEHPNNNIHIFLSRLRKGDTVYIHPEPALRQYMRSCVL